MIGQTTLKQTLKVDIAISDAMVTALELWAKLYENKATWLTTDVRSLNLAASIAGEIATAVTIEMQVEFTGSARATFLSEQFEPVANKLREKVEQGVAKGGLIFKPYLDDGRIAVDYVQADQFYPVKFDSNGNITACIFADNRKISDKYYTRLEMHTLTDAGVEIRNLAFKSSTEAALGQPASLTEVPDWAELAPEALVTGVDRPLYAYFRYPQANNVDPTSPLGVSCYSRAVDLIEQADRQWSRLIWEFESGERAIYVDELAFGKNDDGLPRLPNKRLYRALSQGGQISDEEMFHDWSPEFREASIISGLDAILKKIEFNTGLAYGTLSDPQTVDKTATEIKSSKQRTAATIVDTQKALQASLEQLIWAMDVWATIGGIAPKGAYETAFQFDDSVVVDRDMQFKQDLQLVGTGIMSKVEWRMRNFKETEKVAKQKIAEVMAEQPQDMFEGEGRKNVT